MYLEDEDDIVKKDEAKEEAIKRMNKLNISSEVIDTYKSLDTIFCSCRGCLSPVSKEELQIVKKFESNFGNYVYHIIHSFSNIGETYELLYVSCYKEDWEWENANIDSGYLLVYAENLTIPSFSESGSIIVKNINGSLLRIA